MRRRPGGQSDLADRTHLFVPPALHPGAVHGRQGHRVVNQRHSARSQHRHAGQTRQSRQLGAQVLDHHLLIAQHLVHVHGHALRGTSEDHHGQGPALRFGCARRQLQQRPGPVERDFLSTNRQAVLRVGLCQIAATHAAHQFHQRGGHPQSQPASAHHHHLCDGGGQRQNQFEFRALPGTGRGLDAATQGNHIVANHIHAHATTSQRGHFIGGAQALGKDQLGGLGIVELGALRHQTLHLCLFPQTRQIQTRAIILEHHGHIVEFLRQPNVDRAFGRFPRGQPLTG